MFYIADIFAGGIQMGRRKDMCSVLMQEGFTNDTWQMLTNISWYANSIATHTEDYDYINM